MPFSSYSDFIAKLSSGKRFRTTFAKSSANAAAGVAYRMYELFSSPNFVPGGMIWPGAAGVGTQCTGATVGALDLGTTLAAGETRHLLNAMLYTPTTTCVPGMAYLVDFLAYHPACSVNAPTALGAIALPRYTTGDEVMCSVFVQVLLGATTPSLTLTYVDSGGTSRTATVVSPTNSLPIQTAFMNGSSWWLSMPAVAGVNGVRSITSYTVNSGATATGSVCFVLYKILATIPILTLGTPVERDFAVQMPSLPLIEDQAWGSTPCLGWIVIPGGAMISAANLSGHIETCYG